MKARKRKQVLAVRYMPIGDHCDLCLGARGGVRGNNVIVQGKKLCDYCHADTMPSRRSGMPIYYTLDANHIPIPYFDPLEWARSFEGMDRRVAYDECEHYAVSTVFLGL